MTDPAPRTDARFDLIVFDLDGTLIDSRGDIADAANRALADLGLPPRSDDEILPMIGDGARELLERAVGDRRPEAERERLLGPLLARYLAHYDARPVARTRVYPGVVDGLARLAGLPRAVATNKPGPLARTCLAALGLERHVDLVLGDGDVPRRKPAPDMLDAARARFGVARARTLYVGDMPVDGRTARASGVALCLVAWGYGAGARITEEPRYRAARFEDVVAIARGERAPEA